MVRKCLQLGRSGHSRLKWQHGLGLPIPPSSWAGQLCSMRGADAYACHGGVTLLRARQGRRGRTAAAVFVACCAVVALGRGTPLPRPALGEPDAQQPRAPAWTPPARRLGGGAATPGERGAVAPPLPGERTVQLIKQAPAVNISHGGDISPAGERVNPCAPAGRARWRSLTSACHAAAQHACASDAACRSGSVSPPHIHALHSCCTARRRLRGRPQAAVS